MSTFKRTWKQVGEDKWAEYHIDKDGISSLYGYVEKPPYYAKRAPTPEERAAARKAKKAEEAMESYHKRAAAADFDSIRQRMIEVAEKDPDLLEKLNKDPEAFVLAHDSLRLDELTKRHQERMEKIRERAHSTSGRERGDADLDAIRAHDEYHAERARIESGDYQTTSSEEE